MPKKGIIKEYISTFSFFYTYLNRGIFLILLLSILIGVLDAIGISLFLPLFQLLAKGDSLHLDLSGMGQLSSFLSKVQNLGVRLNLFGTMIFILILFIIKGFLKYLSKVYIIVLEQSFIRKMRLDLLKKLNGIQFKRFMQTDSGRIQNTMTGEIDRIAKAFTSFIGVHRSFLMAIIYFVFALLINVKFSILIVLFGTSSHFLFKKLYRHTRNSSKNLTQQNHYFQGLVNQHIAHFKYLRSSGTLEKFSERMEKSIFNMEDFRKRIGMLSSIGTSISEPFALTILFALIWIQVQWFAASLGSIILSLLFFLRMLKSLIDIQVQWNGYLTNIGSIENITHFKEELQNYSFKNGATIFNKFENMIQLNAVSFNYGSEKVLQNIHLNIPRNKSYAFVGESGSGKTTLISLITGLLLPTEGEVLVDNYPLREMEINSYQQRIGYVSQDPVIFDDTLFNNVTFWDENTPANFNRFEESLKKASLYPFYSELKNREHTRLGNNGINISGGQKQRISIARELYKEIDILILDEATSSLDSETEFAFQESIENLRGVYTMLIVAHRLSTIKNSDRIVYMEKGHILNIDTFENLINRQESFKKMVELQKIN